MLATVVLAAGKGKRMRSDLPKVLHPLLGAPLLEHVLDSLDHLPGDLKPDLKVVVVGYRREQVQEAFPDRGIVWAVQEEQLGTGHAASCGVEAALSIAEGSASTKGKTRKRKTQADSGEIDILVVNGDLPLLRAETLAALVRSHRESKADVTVLTCVKTVPTGYGRIFRTPQGELWDIVEEQDADEATRRMREINVGTYVFRAPAFREHYAKIGRENAQGELYLTDVVVKAAQAGDRVITYTLRDETEIAQVNSRSEMAVVSEILRKRLLEEYMEAGVTIQDPRSTYIEVGVRIGLDTQILPFTVIERGVEIGQGCEVGPFAHLRPGTRLADGASIGNFVEIKNTTVGPATKIRHLSYVGDGIVGRDVNIGAGAIFANFDGRAKNITVVKDRAFVGSGTVLVAPVTIGVGAMTGAGAVVLKNQDIPDGGVAVGVPARLISRKQPTSRKKKSSETGSE